VDVFKTRLRREFIELLEEDKEFRHIIAGLIGLREILDSLKQLNERFNEILERLDKHTEQLAKHTAILEEHTKKLEAHDKKFNEILERLDKHTEQLAKHTAILEEHTKKLEAHDKKFNEILERLEEHDKKFNEIVSRIVGLEARFNGLERRVEVTIGSMGRRWGFDLEKTVLEIFREVLEKKGIEPGKVEKFRFRDRDGSVTGVKGRIIDVDVLVRDDRVYVIEVKSRAELAHVEILPEKARVVGKVLGKAVAKVMLIAVNVDKEAFERARELGIEVIYGNILT